MWDANDMAFPFGYEHILRFPSIWLLGGSRPNRYIYESHPNPSLMRLILIFVSPWYPLADSVLLEPSAWLWCEYSARYTRSLSSWIYIKIIKHNLWFRRSLDIILWAVAYLFCFHWLYTWRYVRWSDSGTWNFSRTASASSSRPLGR